MPDYVVMSPVKFGKKGDPIRQPGEKISLEKKAAEPLLKSGAVATPKDAERLAEAGAATPGMAALAARVSELEAANEGLQEHAATLEAQVAELTEKLAAAEAAAKGGGKPDKPAADTTAGKGGGLDV